MRGALNFKLRQVLKDESLDISVRRVYVGSFLFSRGFFHAATWRILTSSESHIVHRETMKVYRLLVRQDFCLGGGGICQRSNCIVSNWAYPTGCNCTPK